jgi:hypothetical protein
MGHIRMAVSHHHESAFFSGGFMILLYEILRYLSVHSRRRGRVRTTIFGLNCGMLLKKSDN